MKQYLSLNNLLSGFYVSCSFIFFCLNCNSLKNKLFSIATVSIVWSLPNSLQTFLVFIRSLITDLTSCLWTFSRRFCTVGLPYYSFPYWSVKWHLFWVTDCPHTSPPFGVILTFTIIIVILHDGHDDHHH